MNYDQVQSRFTLAATKDKSETKETVSSLHQEDADCFFPGMGDSPNSEEDNEGA